MIFSLKIHRFIQFEKSSNNLLPQATRDIDNQNRFGEISLSIIFNSATSECNTEQWVKKHSAAYD